MNDKKALSEFISVKEDAGKTSIPEEKTEIIKILSENKAYPVCGKSGKICFIKSKKCSLHIKIAVHD